MGAQGGAFAGSLQRLLEHGAEDGRVDFGPVVLVGRARDQFQVGRFQQQGFGAVEQAAVEPVDDPDAEQEAVVLGL